MKNAKVMNMNKRIFTMIVFLLGLLVLVSGVGAVELVHEDFENITGPAAAGLTEGLNGLGWTQLETDFFVENAFYIDHEVSFKGVQKGAVSFDIKRKGGLLDSNRRTIFNILDPDGYSILLFQVCWDSDSNSGLPVFYLRGEPYYINGMGLWGPEIELSEDVSPGQWIHVDLTWDDQLGDYGFFVDGKAVPVRQEIYLDDGGGKKRLKYAREELNESRKKAGLLPTYFDRPFSYILKNASLIRLGLNTHPDRPGFGSSPLAHSVLDNFIVFANEIPDAGGSKEVELAVATIGHDAYTVAGFSGALVEGDELTVTMEGTAGQAALFDIGRRPTSRGEIDLDWRGYYDEAENSVALEDVDFYRVYAAPTYFTADDVARYRLAADDKYLDLGPGVYQTIEQVGEIAGDDEIQTFLVEDLDPYLTYFVMVTAVDDDDSRVVSTTDVSGAAVEESINLEEVIVAPVGGLAMTESSAGIYTGTLVVAGDLDYPEAVVVGHLGAVTAEAEDTFPIDTSVRILVSASPSNLKADEESTSEITVEVRNANGDTISSHPVALSLTTTSEYTGVIGGGQFEDEVGGELSLDFSGETDLFGTVTATFTAGFAAKTAVIVARDLVTNDVGSGYVTQYIEGTTDIELIGLRPSAAKAAGYTVVVTSNRDWLTADGSSRANITAQVLQDGNPVSGHTIIFSVVGEGRVSVINALTDSEGYARAVYTAGTRIGWVLIKATDVTVGISGSTQIELRSDAPAKVAFLVDVLDPVDPADSLGSGIPELYADGRSRAALAVLVTDINDNPNKNTEVDFSVAVGSGSLKKVISLTDEDGKAYATYVAGQIPGTVTVKVTVSSKAPTEAEKAAAENAVLTVPDFEFITE